ncbi:hypothetical protein O3G_MSEX003869 [Manduca sexta]|uniref:Uncharacterized protein n=1 Tax=Manduca sexta TaxID=7130 RepID=A0A921YTI3_MANSE|nr:hypothetical protein O3G_MSEX003869 [Manduca sexta]
MRVRRKLNCRRSESSFKTQQGIILRQISSTTMLTSSSRRIIEKQLYNVRASRFD